jgi:ABC-2 type transport system permease protein/lipopolysaccharide transport system permease protein
MDEFSPHSQPLIATVPPLAAHPARPVWEWNGDYARSARFDLAGSVRRWPLWGLLGWQDVMLRYRRSFIGPFWLTISMGVMVFSLGYIYGGIFVLDLDNYLPFLTIGFLVWGLITAMLSDGCQTFIEIEWIIRQVDLPLSMFPLRVVWRNLIVFLHNAVIYLVLLLLFNLRPGWTLLLAIPGLLLVLANGLWCAMLLGMLSARFRDLPQIVSSVLQVAFFITPIIWLPHMAANRPLLMEANPFYHFIEVVRAPMLGQLPSLSNWGVTLGIGIAGWIGTYLFFRRYHGRIAYWV